MKIFYKFGHHLCLLLLLTLLTSFQAVFAQGTGNGTAVSGRITDEQGELLGGATVVEQGTQNATITDANGQYSLTLTTTNPVLVVNFLGYKPQEVRVGNQRVIDIPLAQDISALDEVVVVGYGHQRKVSVVGAQSSMRMDDIRMPTGNFQAAISGRIAGVVSVQRGGEPGRSDNNIWIRGMSSFTDQPREPLILVDGVERNFDNLDPEDVESFTILKDASATAVYGVRGANGVIIVTTKPGVVGKPQFSFDYYEGFTRMTKQIKLADAFTYMEAANEAQMNLNGKKVYSDGYIINTQKAHGRLLNDDPSLNNKYLYPAVDWMKEMFKDWGHNRHVNMSVRGGVPNATYYVSLSYYNETGQTRNFELENYNTKMNYDRFNFTSNLNLKPAAKTFIDLGFSGYLSSGHYPQRRSSELYSAAMEINPVYMPLMMPDGSRPGISTNGDLRNPYMDLAMGGFSREYNNTINSNIRVTQNLDFWKWSEGLSVKAMLAFDAYNSRSLNYRRNSPFYYFDGALNESGVWPNTILDNEGNIRLVRKDTENTDILAYEALGGASRSTYFETSLNYDRVFGKHRVGAMLLYNMNINRDLTTGELEKSLADKSQSLAARLTYSWNDRYLFEANLGYNGSQNFKPENRYGVFPAFGVGWVVSNEPFWKSVKPVISYLKLRYTLGWVGTDIVGDANRRFMYEEVWWGHGQGDPENFGPRLGNYDERLLDALGIAHYAYNVGWTRSRKQDLGIDINFLNDKLSLTVDLFHEYRDRIFLQRNDIPDYAGLVEKPWANVGIVKNRGVEFQVEYIQDFTPNIGLTFRGNFTYNKDTIVENAQPPTPAPYNLERRGTNVNGLWGLVAEGLFATQEEIDAHATQFGVLHPGDVKYRDVNEDGEINEEDYCLIGQNDVPAIVYGFGFDLRLWNFSIGALFQGTGMVDRIVRGNAIHPFSGGNGFENLYANIDDRWSPLDPWNDDVFYPRLSYTKDGNNNNTQPSTWWLKDMSYLRLKQLNLSYNFPKKWTDKLRIKNASLYIMATNVFTISKFKLWDPELNSDNGTAYPNISSYSIGLKFNF